MRGGGPASRVQACGLSLGPGRAAAVPGREARCAEAGWWVRVLPATPNPDASSEGGAGGGLLGRPANCAWKLYLPTRLEWAPNAPFPPLPHRGLGLCRATPGAWPGA